MAQGVPAGAAAAGRQWAPERFKGAEGRPYLVQGKGGLWREVRVPEALAERLEETRRDAQDPPPPPCDVVDSRVHYKALYDLGGGNAWSRSFTDASKRALGWTTGAHGLRRVPARFV